MKIYRLTQSENIGYDTYDTIIVVASTEEKAKQITPNSDSGFSDVWGSWASSPDKVTAELIGTTTLFKAGTILCASFNAG
jgi:hypothetical protein